MTEHRDPLTDAELIVELEAAHARLEEARAKLHAYAERLRTEHGL